MTDIEARKWQIAENLHRAELTVLERADHVAEWIRLTAEQQVVSGKLPETREGRPGVPASVKGELGIGDDEAKRAVKISALAPETKETAQQLHLDDNQAALLEAAASADPEKQVETLRSRAARRHALTSSEKTDKQFAALVAAWGRAGPEARAKFLASVAHKTAHVSPSPTIN
jgi:hypothetical protein